MSSGDLIGVSVRCTNRSDVVLRLLEDRVQEGLEECAEFLRDKAKGYCPVDTGALQASIDAKPVGNRHVVIYAGGDSLTNAGNGKHVDYAQYVEFGTSRTPAQPFMRPAKENHKGELKQIMDGALSRR